MTILPFAIVFVATLLCDFAWTKYNLFSAAKDAHRAAAWSSAIIAFGTINVISYTANHWLVIPALLGAYVGTYVAIWWEKRQHEPAKEPASDYCDELGCECGGYMNPPLHKPMSPAYEGPRLSGTMPRVKPACNHDHCRVVMACEGVVRWSCGRIEG